MPIDANPSLIFFLPMLVAFSVTLIAILLLKPLAIRLGLTDEPGGRKTHTGSVPLIGGLGIFLGFGFALLTLNISLSPYRCLIACAVLITLTGLLDDFHELTPRSRLFVQLLVAVLITAWGGADLHFLGNIFGLGSIELNYLAYPLGIVAIVALINAVNMSDGADGLAGTLAFVEFFYLGWIAHHAGSHPDEQIIDVIIATLFAFLCFNFPWRQKASIFMGDSGSMLLGVFLVWFCLTLSQPPLHGGRPVVFLWIMAMPLWDISNVVWRRMIRGFSPFRPDRGHLHHFLLQKGFSSLQTVMITSFFAATCGAIGMAGEYWHVPEVIMFVGFLLCFSLYVLLLEYGWRKIN